MSKPKTPNAKDLLALQIIALNLIDLTTYLRSIKEDREATRKAPIDGFTALQIGTILKQMDFALQLTVGNLDANLTPPEREAKCRKWANRMSTDIRLQGTVQE